MCKICETKPVHVFTNKRKVCKTCFIRWFQSKVLYTIKKFSMVKKGDVIGYKPGRGFREAVLEDVLRYYETRAPVEVVKLPNKKVNKRAISSTSDMIAKEIVSNLINGNLKNIKERPVEGQIIKPLYLFLDKEVLLYAKLRNLKFTKSKDSEDKLDRFIDSMEKKHPEVKRAIVNGYLVISR